MRMLAAGSVEGYSEGAREDMAMAPWGWFDED
jgi:hypothetical protein